MQYPSDGEIEGLQAATSCGAATQRCTTSATMCEAVVTGKERLFPAHLAMHRLLVVINKWLKKLPGKTLPILADYLSLSRKLLKLPLLT